MAGLKERLGPLFCDFSAGGQGEGFEAMEASSNPLEGDADLEGSKLASTGQHLDRFEGEPTGVSFHLGVMLRETARAGEVHGLRPDGG